MTMAMNRMVKVGLLIYKAVRSSALAAAINSSQQLNCKCYTLVKTRKSGFNISLQISNLFLCFKN